MDFIQNLFYTEPPKHKIPNNNYEHNKNIYDFDNKVNELFPALNQGYMFNKFQNKIIDNTRTKIKNKSVEGFEGQSQSQKQTQTQTTDFSPSVKSQGLLDSNHITTQQRIIISGLQKEYDKTLSEYNSALTDVTDQTKQYVKRISRNNPYKGKNIKIGEQVMYVTNQGVAKWYPSKQVFTSVMGRNGCPTPKDMVTVNVEWKDDYKYPGVTIPTDPPLMTGTAMVEGQSCGNEGENIYVNTLINKSTAEYLGCYQDDADTSVMTFIGGSPPPPTQIQNGDFSQPTLSNNSYRKISDNSVPGWTFNAVLMNNSSSWGYPTPYPVGSQAVSIQKTHYMYQNIYLIANTNYTISFYACGRDCCDKSHQSNPVKISIQNVTDLDTISPPVNSWINYTYNFTVTSDNWYVLRFEGTWTSGDRSTAIQGVQLSSSGTTSTSGTYSYEDCKQAAIDNGYQYFGLQQVNPSNSLGYCGVSNSEPTVTQYGKSYVPTGENILWSSETSDQTGNMATLTNLGQLVVNNTNNVPVFQTENTSKSDASYIGCYVDDTDKRAMTKTSGDSRYPLDQCQQIAEDGNYKYYAGQNVQTKSDGTYIERCYASNDLTASTKYGPSTNCKTIDGIVHGGSAANAIYSVEPGGNYYLIMQDDGNMCIYRGTGPSDSQGMIWCAGTNGKQQKSNSAYTASKGKYGKNWVANGATFAAGEFIASTAGDMVLIMQTDGNLVLKTFTDTENCTRLGADSKTNVDIYGGGTGANALYKLSQVGYADKMSSVAYVDADSQLHPYDKSNVTYSNTYTKIPGTDSVGYDITGASFGDATIESCQDYCNNNSDCAGFAFTNNVCYPKNSGMYPNGSKQLNSSVDLYTRNLTPKNPPSGASDVTRNIDSVKYNSYSLNGNVTTENFDNYTKGGNLDEKYGLKRSIDTVKQKKLDFLQTKLGLLSDQIQTLTNKFGSGLNATEQQVEENSEYLDQYLKELKENKNKLRGYTSGLDNILNESDILVLQQNYSYYFWSILATGTLLIALNISKK